MLILTNGARGSYTIGGNGNDPFDIYLTRARTLLIKVLERTTSDNLNSGLTVAQRNLILNRKSEIISDLNQTQWVMKSDKNECAWTAYQRSAPIYFRRDFCKSDEVNLIDIVTAAEILFHETIHHFQNQNSGDEANESEAKVVASLFMQSARMNSAMSPWVELGVQKSGKISPLDSAPPLIWTFDDTQKKSRVFSRILSPFKLDDESNAISNGFVELDTENLSAGWRFHVGGLHPAPVVPTHGDLRHPNLEVALWSGNTLKPEANNWLLNWGGARIDFTDESLPIQVFSVQTGTLYNTSRDEMVSTPLLNAPSSRVFHAATQIGHRALIWGGMKRTSSEEKWRVLNDGAFFNFETKSWEALPKSDWVPSARFGHLMVSNDEYAIVWGGCDEAPDDFDRCWGSVNNGAQFDLKSGSWTPIVEDNLFFFRSSSDPYAWTGNELILIARDEIDFLHAIGGKKYNPKNKTWTKIAALNRSLPNNSKAVWTGTEVAVVPGFGDLRQPLPLKEIFLYNPRTDKWRILSFPHEINFSEASVVWTGLEIVILGEAPSVPGPISPRKFTSVAINPN